MCVFVCVQAAVSTTTRSPGKRGPARNVTISVLRRPGDREGKTQRDRDNDRDSEVEPSVSAPDDQSIRSPEEAETEGEQAEEVFGGPIRDLPPDELEHGNGDYDDVYPPPPSPTPLERGDNAPSAAERQQGYRISADLQDESDSQHDHNGDDGEEGQMQAEEEEDKDVPDAVLAEADEDLAGGGGQLMEEV